MDPKRRALKRYAVPALALLMSLLLIAICAEMAGQVTDRDSLARWIQRNDRTWRDLLSRYPGEDLAAVPERDTHSPVLQLAGIDEVLYIDYHPEAGAFCFFFRHLQGPQEGYAALVQAETLDQAASAEPNLALTTQAWTLTERTARTRRWEGGFAGQGYVLLEEIAPGWYYEEANLPT